MEWMIEGADANTGEDVRLIVEAESSDAAEDIARGKGVMISNTTPVGVAQVVAIPPPAIEVSVKPERQPAAKRRIPPANVSPASSSPDYQDIVSGSKLLKVMSTVAGVVGYLSFLGALTLMIWPLIQLSGAPSVPMILAAAMTGAIPAAFGVVMLLFRRC